MTDKEKDFAVKINIDKAKNKAKVAIFLIIISIITYIPPLLEGEFDFGIVFEIISLIILIIARNYMEKYDEIKSKICVICSMIPVGWLLIYDIILFLSVASDILELVFLPYSYVFTEILSISYMYILFEINRDLSKAENPVKYKNSTDWFYETYEEKNGEIK